MGTLPIMQVLTVLEWGHAFAMFRLLAGLTAMGLAAEPPSPRGSFSWSSVRKSSRPREHAGWAEGLDQATQFPVRTSQCWYTGFDVKARGSLL